MHRSWFLGLAVFALLAWAAPGLALAPDNKASKPKAADKDDEDKATEYVGTWSAITDDNHFRQVWVIKKGKKGKLQVSGYFRNENGVVVGRFLGTKVMLDDDSGELQFDQDFGAPGCRKPVASWDGKPHVRASVEDNVLSFNSYPQGSDRPYQAEKITLNKVTKKKKK